MMFGMGLLDTVSAAARSLGNGLLGAGTGQTDATPDMRRYRVYAAEAAAMGETPKPYVEWIKTR